MRRVVLSHPLAVKGLVSRYLTNNLIARFPISGQQAFAHLTIRSGGVIRYYPGFPRAILDLGVRRNEFLALTPLYLLPKELSRSTCMF